MPQGNKLLFLLTWLVCCAPGLDAESTLRVVQEWSEPIVVYPSEAAKQTAIDKKYYIRGEFVPIDVDVDSKRIFVTFPRFAGGRPVTLGTVDEQGRILPYPDYSWHDNQGTNCNGLTSVFRVAVDKCDRIWMVDTGMIGDSRVCPPKVIAFNLNTDKMVYEYKLDNSSYTAESLYITPVVDVRSILDCSKTFIYVADVSGHGLLVLDVQGKRSWRLTHPSFGPNPEKTIFTVDGISFELPDGILGMALSPYVLNTDRRLYYHPLASTNEYYVDTKVIRNESLATNGSLASNAVHMFPAERPNQSAAEAMDRNGVLYFGLMDPPSIWCWNSKTEFGTQNFHPVAINNKTLQFASGVKVRTTPLGEEVLWVITTSFQKYMNGTLNPNEINFRIHTKKILEILANSPCGLIPLPLV